MNDISSIDRIRAACRGLPPLDARLEPWMAAALSQPETLAPLLEEHGSPAHLLHVPPFGRNVERLLSVAAEADGGRGVDLRVFMARKANKALCFVDAARDRGWGVDVAGVDELRQCLERGVEPSRLVVTAAVKPRELYALAAARGVFVVLDDAEEARALAQAVAANGRTEPLAVGLRLGGFRHRGDTLFTRFGIDVDEAVEAVRALWPEVGSSLVLEGLHFHLDGYDPEQRVSAIDQSLEILDALRADGHPITSLDMGGGLPVRYLESTAQWRTFWAALRASLLDDSLLDDPAPAVTWRRNGLGLSAHSTGDGREIVGSPAVYPFAQELEAPAWLARVLAATRPSSGRSGGETIARALRDRGSRERGLELRCEPGRSVFDGCGLTIARVERIKRHVEGFDLASVAMNRTQCRTSSVDFLVDPLVVPQPGPSRSRAPREQVFFVGAYCIENEMLSWRPFACPQGLEAGDLVAWPNTAGYFMHFLESRSHQFPLARNLVVPRAPGEPPTLDPIDAAPSPAPRVADRRSP